MLSDSLCQCLSDVIWSDQSWLFKLCKLAYVFCLYMTLISRTDSSCSIYQLSKTKFSNLETFPLRCLWEISCFKSLWFRGVARRHARVALERRRECEVQRKKESPCNSLCCTRNQIPLSNICKAAPRSEIPTDSMNYWKYISNFVSTWLANRQIMPS